jgi:hypothetical protein
MQPPLDECRLVERYDLSDLGGGVVLVVVGAHDR